MRRLLIGVLLVLVVSLSGVVSAFADSSGASLERQAAGNYPGEMPMEKQAPLPIGTVITTQNWEQYKDYMPGWMQWLYSGEYGYKLLPNQSITVGPTIPKALPKKYAADT